MPYRGFGVRSQRYPVSPAYPAEPSEDPQHSHEIPVSGSSLPPLTSSWTTRITFFPLDLHSVLQVHTMTTVVEWGVDVLDSESV